MEGGLVSTEDTLGSLFSGAIGEDASENWTSLVAYVKRKSEAFDEFSLSRVLRKSSSSRLPEV